MRLLLPTIDVDYIGADIVHPLIEANKKKYQNDKISFVHLDLIKDVYPTADLMICRDFLFHLSYKDTRSVLRSFVESGISYFLTTTYINDDDFSNREIATGDFRLIDLFSTPYNFSSTPLAAIDDGRKRRMCLWSRKQVSLALIRFGLHPVPKTPS